MKTFYTCCAILIFFTSCSFVMDSYQDNNHEVMQFPDRPLSIVFSHNINGETHPCGCRHFPLGGLPQVAGQMEKIRKKNNLIYVDTGDTFFPSSTLPKSVELSLKFAANNLAKGMDKIGLKYYVPGDQDLAAGWDFLVDLSNNYKFSFLLSNLKDDTKLKHKKWAVVKNGKQKYYFLGILHPDLLKSNHKSYFEPVEKGIASGLELIKANGFDEKNNFHHLIVLSHSGIGYDESLAKKFQMIDWIIGAHSQSFFRFSREVGNVQIGQVLSRNHYLGEISFSEKEKYIVHEIRDELKDILKPNEFLSFIDSHKEKMKELQSKEQSMLSSVHNGENQVKSKFITALSCIECHSDQGNHWKKTPHALAYATLINANEYKNLNCIKCHSYGMGEESGFETSEDIFVVDESVKDKKETKQKFLNAYKKLVEPIESSRKLNS